MKKVLPFLLAAGLAASVYSETVVLQKGLDSYNGVKDLTIFDDSKAENYSWYNNGQYYGKPTDGNLVNCAFFC